MTTAPPITNSQKVDISCAAASDPTLAPIVGGAWTVSDPTLFTAADNGNNDGHGTLTCLGKDGTGTLSFLGPAPGLISATATVVISGDTGVIIFGIPIAK
jgi:hypothetical protein